MESAFILCERWRAKHCHAAKPAFYYLLETVRFLLNPPVPPRSQGGTRSTSMSTLNISIISITGNGIVQQKAVSRRRFLRQACRSTVGLSCFSLISESFPVLGQVVKPPPAANELVYWSAAKLAQAIRNKVVSSEEVVTAHLSRIAQVNGKINAVVQLASERALAEARAADVSLAQGQIKGPLHGHAHHHQGQLRY